MQCLVYRSTARQGAYLFVRRSEDLDDVPEELLARLGRLELALEVELHRQRQLARTTGAQVMSHIEEQGFYLQLPPDRDTL